ncbi:MAG: type II secretion system protein GspF [Deltaproteobacteria bacterium]|nr:type II secretion system protein GspF [Deltaproteobacteria bacterium]
MPIYAYTGLTSQGRAVAGVIDADSPKTARISLRRTGIFPTAVREEQTATATTNSRASDSISHGFERVSAQDLALLTRQFATLTKAGLPLIECLGTLIEQVEQARLKRVLTHVRQQVREGRSLADALQAHPRVFSGIYVNMVRAGEESGTLDAVLARLADYSESQARLLRTVQSALTYPVIMIVVSLAILTFLLTYVVPQVTKIFTETGRPLPLATRILLGCSSFFAHYWWPLLLLLAIGTLIAVRFVRTPKGRERYDRLLLRLPWVGKLVQRLNVARFARTMSTLLASGVPILTALGIVTHLLSNSLLRRAVEAARASVQEGESLAAPLGRSGLFPALLTQMVAVGERSGELESMLARAADAYDEEVTVALSRVTSLLEPFTILLMGGIILFIVLAILLPIFDLNQLVH